MCVGQGRGKYEAREFHTYGEWMVFDSEEDFLLHLEVNEIKKQMSDEELILKTEAELRRLAPSFASLIKVCPAFASLRPNYVRK